MRPPQISDKLTLNRVSALLPGVSVEGAFALGVLCASAWAQGNEPPLEALERIAEGCPGETFVPV